MLLASTYFLKLQEFASNLDSYERSGIYRDSTKLLQWVIFGLETDTSQTRMYHTMAQMADHSLTKSTHILFKYRLFDIMAALAGHHHHESPPKIPRDFRTMELLKENDTLKKVN